MKKPAAKRTRKTRSPKRASAARGGAGSAGAQLLEELDPSELLALQEAMGLSDDERSATELLAVEQSAVNPVFETAESFGRTPCTVTPISETRTNWRCFGAPRCNCRISSTVSTG